MPVIGGITGEGFATFIFAVTKDKKYANLSDLFI